MGRNLIDEERGTLASMRYLIVDRDTNYTQQFRKLLKESGTEVIRLPPLSPNLNAYSERFVRSIKEKCLGRMIFVGQASLRRAISEYMAHYHSERNTFQESLRDGGGPHAELPHVGLTAPVAGIGRIW